MNYRNGPIDGWRGISVILVVLGHSLSYRFDAVDLSTSLRAIGISLALMKEIALRCAALGGELGVHIFFVISGYLITSLLLAEERRNGSASIPAFYVRRAFRIIPAFAFFWLIVLLLRSSDLLLASNEAFIRSALYICNASEFKCSWWFGHTWSLSVEEQFYLLWPCIFALVADRAKTLLAITITLSVMAIYLPQASSFA